jgi:hypothetical protein
MLDGVIERMGYPVRKTVDPKRRGEIIDRLEKGEISAEQAAELLKAGGEDDSRES